jgi:hypothetical protein
MIDPLVDCEPKGGNPMRAATGLSAGALLLVVCALTTADPVERAAIGGRQESEAFFNGKDLDGWEGLGAYWTVREGAIVGKVPAAGLGFRTYLCSRRKYKDFELSVQVRIRDGKGNSGVQFRSRVVDAEKFAVAGPQANMGRPFWGGLYGERDPGRWLRLPKQAVVREIVKPAEFNDYVITCVGKRVTIKLNGTTTVDDHFPEIPDEGIIAWQLRGDYPGMEVTFRNIQFKDLSR